MYLTKDEERMLSGEDDYVAMRCMEWLVKYGDAAGAERMVDIDGTVNAPISGTRGLSELKIDFSGPEMRNKKVKVYTHSGQVSTPIDGWEDIKFPPWNDPDHHKAFIDSWKPMIRAGVHPTCSCTYYLISTLNPTLGQHCAWGESSAMPWCNAILGARTNYDGCFQAAYTGKIPMYGMHLEENRIGTHMIRIETELDDPMDYDLLGFYVGGAVGHDVPVFTGIGKPSWNDIIKMNGALNTTGAIHMYHIPGLTPEARTVEDAFNGDKPDETVTVTRDELREAYYTLNYGDDENVNFVFLGCPHLTLDQVREVAWMLEGKRCTANLWVMTNPWTFKQAEMMGYRDTIKRAGGLLLSGTCPGLMHCLPPNTDVMATNSAKQGYYLHGLVYPKELGTWYGTTEDCIDAAIKGKWDGKWIEGN